MPFKENRKKHLRKRSIYSKFVTVISSVQCKQVVRKVVLVKNLHLSNDEYML